MKRLAVATIVLTLVAVQSGCSPLSMAKRGLTELRGAHGWVDVVREASRSFYQSVGGITIRRVTNTIEPVCSARMRDLVESALRAEAQGASEKLDGQNSCAVDVDITFNKRPGGTMALIGKGALLVGRARVFDAGGGQQADLIVAVSSEAMRTDEREMAAVFARELCGHIAR